MLKIILLFITFLTWTSFARAQAPAWQWAQEANSNGTEYANDVVYDNFSGNVYIGGRFDSNLSAKYGASFSSSNGLNDGFVAKYTAAGSFQWALKIGGIAEDEVRAVATDAAGDVYVSGLFKSTVDFDPSASTFNLTSSGGEDGFLAKYTSSGIFLWAVKFGGTGDDQTWKMHCDANGIYLTGYYVTAPATFYSYGNPTTKTTFSTGGNIDAFGAKYNSAGIIQWVISGGSNKVDYGFTVIADANNVYFIGRYDADITFTNAAGAASPVLQAQQNNKPQVFIIAYSQSGNVVWQTNITCTTNKDVVGWAITQDASNLYVSGYMDGTINFKWPSPTLTQNISAGGGLDIYLAKLSKTGNFLWNTAATGSGSGDQMGRALEVDNTGNVILSGNFKSNLDYTGAGGPLLSANGYDIFVSSYSNAGAFQWAAKAGNGNDDYVNGLSVDNTGGIYLVGDHADGAIFGTYSLTAGSGNSNIFVAKIGCVALSNNTIATSQTICAGNTPSVLTGSLPVGTGSYNYTWEQSLNNASWANAAGTYTSQNFAPPTLTVSTYYRRKVNVIGTCANTATSTSIMITVTPLPTTANAGLPQTICSFSTALAANTPTVGTGAWSVLTGTGIVTTLSSPTSLVTGLSNGINRFVWTITNGVCAASSSTVTITKDVSPSISNAGSAQTICTFSTTLSANAPTTGTGVWSIITGTGSVTSTSSPSSTVTGLSNGINRFVWTISNGVCPSSSSTVTVTKDISPSVSNAGVPQIICTASFFLSANTPSIGTGAWSVITGTGAVTTPTSPSSAVTGLSFGTNRLVWTISNGVCPSSSNTVTITRNVPPSISNAGSAQTICSFSTTLSANTPTTGTGLWSVITGTGSISNNSSPSSSVTGLSNGTNQFVWTISNGVCPSSSSTVTVTKDIFPTTSIAGTSQTICSFSTALAANTPTIGTGAWSVLTGTGVVTTLSSPTSPATGLSNGINRFVWTISNGVCASTSSTVTVTKDISPSVSNAGTPQTICSFSTTLAANTPTTGTGAWSVITGLGSVTSPGSPSSQVTGLSNGINRYVWTISNGVCPSSSSTVTVTKDISPSVSNAGSSQTICSFSTTLAANTPTSGTGAWSVLTGSGAVTTPASPNSLATGLTNGINRFVWTISNGVCASSSSTVTVTKDISPSLSNAGLPQTICSFSTTLAANTPTTGTGLWSVITGTASVSSTSSPTSSVTGLSDGTNQFVWTISNGVCPSSSSTVTVTKDISPSVSNAGSQQTICSFSTTFAANTPTTGTGVWSVITGTGSVTSLASPNSSVSGLSDGTNEFVWTISNGVCTSSSSTVTVIKDISPSASNAGPPQTICSLSTTLAANAAVTGTGLWTVIIGTASLSTPASETSSVLGLSDGINQFAWTISNGTCPSSSSTVTVTKDIPPSVSNAGSPQTICSFSTTLAANTPTTGTGVWSVLTGTGSVISLGLPNSSATGLSEGTNEFVWTISNGVCPSSTSTVIVTKDVSPSVSNAGLPQTICSYSTTLAANTPITGTGLWSVMTGTSSVSIPASETSNVIGLSDGINQFVWTITSGVCTPSSSTVTVIKDIEPTLSTAGSPQTTCSFSVVLSANTPTTGTGLWVIATGAGSLTLPSSPTSTATNLSNGINTYVWIISNGSCPISSDTVIITKDISPTIPLAGNDLAICTATANLLANTAVSGTGTWSVTSGTGIISNQNSPSSVITNLSIGINSCVWTIGNGVCPSLNDTVKIVQDEQPTLALAGNSQVLCSANATITANIPVIGSGNWTITAGSGTLASASSAITTVSNMAPGVNIFMWTISNGTCPPTQDTLSIAVDAFPSPPNAGSDKSVCSENILLEGNSIVNGSGNWILISGSGNLENSMANNSAVAFLGAGLNTFRWTIRNGVCADLFDDVIITRDLNPDQAIAGNDQTTDYPVITLSAVQPSVGIGQWSVIEGTALIENTANANTIGTSLITGNNIFRWTVRNGVCPETIDDIIITLNPFRIPNAFSPNDDGINDSFVVPGMEYYNDVKFSVFNRWSALVYEADHYKNDWTGISVSNEKLSDDTYYYIIKVPALNMDFKGYVIIKKSK